MFRNEPTDAAAAEAAPRARAWFCVRAQPKHEHIAAAQLRQEEAVEVFLPRIRYKRVAREKPVWTTEALFPGYLFARFDWRESLRKVHHARGVRGVVHFGTRWPTVSETAIAELQSVFGQENVHVLNPEPEPGDVAVIAGGTFQGLTVVITRVMPARERVAVLLEFLGTQTTVELDLHLLVLDKQAPHRSF